MERTFWWGQTDNGYSYHGWLKKVLWRKINEQRMTSWMMVVQFYIKLSGRTFLFRYIIWEKHFRYREGSAAEVCLQHLSNNNMACMARKNIRSMEEFLHYFVHWSSKNTHNVYNKTHKIYKSIKTRTKVTKWGTYVPEIWTLLKSELKSNSYGPKKRKNIA